MNDRQDLVTRCPYCTTTFRVTFEQLDMASGAVRCGACLRIFQGDDEFVPGATEGSWDLMTEATELDDMKSADEESVVDDPSLLERNNGDAKILDIDASYWLQWECYVSECLTPFVDAEVSGGHEKVVLCGSTEGEGDREGGPGQEEATIPALVSGLDLGNDPDELVGDYVVEKKQHPLWAILVLILLVTGFLQYAWFNQDIYAQDDEYRPLYLAVCSWLGCQLPVYSNFSVLTTTNLVVRSHPKVKDALIVDAIIRNSGNYRQQFPLLKLQFMDIEGSLVAIRRFNPRDYLAGELRGLRNIPANTEVRFSLEIVHPGEHAVGFSLEVVEIRW